jgi:aryl-alcohol dehydrogenase-like predicted oxidoreductase
MRTRRLGTSEITVSVVGLGCNNFGRRVDEAGTRAVVDAALGAGVTFLDTADIYGTGESETLLGRVLQGRRDSVVLTTKWGKPMGDGAERRGRRDYIRQAIDASLARLQVEQVDLYQHHEEDPDTPLEETVGAMKELYDEGKIRAFGTSNYAPATLARTSELAHGLGLPLEAELLPACERLGLGFIPYFPLASGLLTGKVTREQPPAPGTRLHGRNIDEAELVRVEALTAWAKAHGLTLLDVAIGGLAAQPAVVSVIAGATKPEQVRANAKAGEWGPSPAELAELVAL